MSIFKTTFQKNDRELVIIPEGTYKAQLEIMIPTTSKKGDPMIKFIFRVFPANQQVYLYAMIAGDRNWALKQALEALSNKTYPIDTPLTFDSTELEGKYCNVIIKHKEYNNQKQAFIQKVLPVTVLTPKVENVKQEEPKPIMVDELGAENLPF